MGLDPQAAVIALDTNLLLYAHRPGVPEHFPARRAIERASRDARGWGIAVPCLAEFWSIATAGLPPASSTPRQAREFLASLADANAAIWLPREDFRERLTRLAMDLNSQGPRVFDLQIALIAFENGATELWTHDRSFVSIPGLPVLDPIGI